MTRITFPGHPKGGIQCKATSKQSGQRCKRKATPGHLVCRMHGSATPQARAKVEAQIMDIQARKAVEALGGDPVDNPLEALRQIAGEVLAWKEQIAKHVLELERLRYSSETEQIRGEVILYERALDRCVNALAMIAKLNIDDRLAAIEEAKVERVVAAVESALDALGLPVSDQLKAKALVAGHLRAVG